MWKVIRNCSPRKETTQPVYIKDNKLLANDFNEFFTLVGQRAAEASQKLAAENNRHLKKRPTPPITYTTNEFHSRLVTTAVIRKIV